jgi:hypothetical protein
MYNFFNYQNFLSDYFTEIELILSESDSGPRPLKRWKASKTARGIAARRLWATNSCYDTLKTVDLLEAAGAWAELEY